jgi:hypothetical protein
MIRSLLNWRSLLALVAIVIVSATIFYSQYLARKIAMDERQKVETWVAASKAILKNPGMDLTLPNLIRNGQQAIPIIETNEQDSIIEYINLDSAGQPGQGLSLPPATEIQGENSPVEVTFSRNPISPTAIITVIQACWMRCGIIRCAAFSSSRYLSFLSSIPSPSVIRPPKPALGGDGQGDGPSAWHACILAGRLGGDAKEKAI